MSVTDPLIKNIKGCVQQFLNLNSSISDNNVYLLEFMQTIEKIFNQGLIIQQNTIFFERTIDPFSWMLSVSNQFNYGSNFSYKNCVDQVKERQDLCNNIAKFRLLVKFCLLKRCLHVPIEVLRNSAYNETFYISTNSILGNEILTEILLSVLYQVAKLNFNLDLLNGSFLDLTWCLPEVLNIELVPCRNLGIAVSFISNKAIVIKVESNGVAAEDGNIKVGDVLDKLNDVQINSSTKGRLNLIMKSYKLKPITVRLIKAYQKDNGQIYGPIINFLRNLEIDIDTVKKQYKEIVDDNSIIRGQKNKNFSVYGHILKYLGNMNLGNLGGIKDIQKALNSTISGQSSPDEKLINRINKIALFEIEEIGLKIRDKETSEVILDHPYMKISSCGNIPRVPHIFGYCASEVDCDIADNFTCFMFESSSIDEADFILQSMAQGFHRTHYAV